MTSTEARSAGPVGKAKQLVTTRTVDGLHGHSLKQSLENITGYSLSALIWEPIDGLP